MRRHWCEACVVLALLALLVAGLFLAYGRPAWISLPIGGPTDAAYLQGFYAVESNPAFTFRWTDGEGQVRLSGIGRDRPLRLELWLAGPPGSDVQPRPVTVSVAGRPLAQVTVASTPERGPQVYTLAVPPDNSASGDLVVTLSSATFTPGGDDTRELGLLVTLVTVAYGPGLGWPPLLPAVSLLVLILAVYLAVRLAGWGWWTALGLSAAALLLLVVLLTRARLLVAPYLVALAAAVLIVDLFLAFVWVVARQGRPLPRIWVALAAFAPLPLAWRFLVMTGRFCQPVDLPTLLANLQNLALALFLPPLDSGDYLPLRVVILAGTVYLVVLALRRRAGPAGRWLSPEAILAVVIAGVFLVYLTLFLQDKVFSGGIPTDFAAHFNNAQRFFVQGGPLYDLEAIRRNHFGDVYKYPPLYSLLMFPLVRLPILTALQIWQEFNLLLLAVAGILLARMYQFGRHLWLWGGTAFLLLNWRPIGDALGYGQADIVLFLLIVGALYSLRRGRGWLAGVLLALCALLKLYPAFLLLFLLLRREWRAVGGFFLGLLGLAGLAVLLLGWPAHAMYLRNVLPITGGGTAWIENQTLNGFFNRLFTDRLALLPQTDPRADLLALAVAAGLTLLSAWLVYRYAERGTLRYDLGYSLLLVTMILALPAAWVHYETILALPFVLLLVVVRDLGTIPYKTVAALAVSFGLLCLGNAWLLYNGQVFGRLWQMLLSYKVYGMVLLWGGLAALLLGEQAADLGARVTATGRGGVEWLRRRLRRSGRQAPAG